MNRVRDQLLAGASLANDQNARGRIGNRFHSGQHGSQRGTLANDLAEIHRDADLFAQIVALPLELFFETRNLIIGFTQARLRAISLGHVLTRDEQSQKTFARIALGAS